MGHLHHQLSTFGTTKNWATISQERLNLQVHMEMTDTLNMADIGNQLVSASNDRQNRFGKFDVN